MHMQKFIIITFILLFLLYIPAGTNCTINNKNKLSSFEAPDNIFFTRWLGYMGYALYEGSSHIGLSYINYNKSKDFENKITSIELRPANSIIEVTNFNFIDGSSSEELDIKTLDIHFDIKASGSCEINNILIHTRDDREYLWDIGAIIIDVVDQPMYGHLNLGVRSFVEFYFNEYFFSLSNLTSDIIQLCNLEYIMPEGKLNHKLKLSTSLTNDKQSNNQQFLMPDEYRLFRYKLEYNNFNECYFFIFKPFLEYEFNTNIYSMPLDYTIYSRNFDQELINFIKQNQTVKSTVNKTIN